MTNYLEVYLNAKKGNDSVQEATIRNLIILDFKFMQMIRQSIALNTEYLKVLQNKVIFKLNKSLDIQYFSVLQIINNSLFSPL